MDMFESITCRSLDGESWWDDVTNPYVRYQGSFHICDGMSMIPSGAVSSVVICMSETHVAFQLEHRVNSHPLYNDESQWFYLDRSYSRYEACDLCTEKEMALHKLQGAEEFKKFGDLVDPYAIVGTFNSQYSKLAKTIVVHNYINL